MKSPHIVLIVSVVLVAGSGLAQERTAPATAETKPLNEAAAQQRSPAQLAIAAAQQQIEADPKKAQTYNELALAYLRRTRETADTKYLTDADTALAHGLKLEPENFQMQRTRIALMLRRRDYANAKEQAEILHHRTPDDVMSYAYIAEADIALGDYLDAETNAQWMMNLRPNNIPVLLIGAELRTLYGDPGGAIDFLSRAYSETSPTEVEALAWIADRIASIQIDSGQADAAEQTLAQAERTFPDYPYTTENLARVRMAQNRAGDAVPLWMRAAQMDGNPHVLYELARAEQAAGHSTEAGETYAAFEKAANDPASKTDESQVDLILMETRSPDRAANALKVAQQEIAVRQDVWSLDAYAWALYANAKYQEADAAEQKAIAVGIRSAQIFDHAGHIAQKLNRDADAARLFRLAVQSDPGSEYASDALKSAGAGVIADTSKPTDLKPATNPSLRPTAAPAEPMLKAKTDSAEPAQPAALANPKTAIAAAAFAPVPEALLTPSPTSTSQQIKRMQANVARNPNDSANYAELGAAYLQRARETGDVSDFQLAEQSLTKSLDLVSADFAADAALGTMASVCMGEHRFADALSYGQKALSLGTGDMSPFAIIGDAYTDMGEYDKAALAYSRLTPRDMTLAPRAAYARDTRLAYLKFIAGDTPGAIALMETAVREGIEAQLQGENLAWLYYELGEFYTQAGDAESADIAYVRALTIHPGDYRVLAALGKLRANNGRYAEAIGLYQRAIAVVPMPIFIAELGDLYAKSGNQAEAKKQYALVEYIGLLGRINQVIHNRDLALFYADHDMKLPEALDLAYKELEVRHDIYTYDALAWSLYKNGKYEKAAEASEKATRFGTRDPLLLFHAGMIAERMGQAEKARGELREALQINPHFHLAYAAAAQQQVNAMQVQSASKAGPDQYAR